MVMRVGGLATGMDIESIVNKLMEAERMPLVRLTQDRQMLEWKRDAFRDINKALLELDNMILDMKLSKTYFTKKVTSSNESAVTAQAATSALEGSFSIKVEQLATTAINVSTEEVNIDDINKSLKDLGFDLDSDEFTFITYNEDGSSEYHSININENDTINDVLNKIYEKSNKRVRAFYDSQSQKFVFETTRTGKYNPDGPEIDFDEDNTLFTEVFKLKAVKANGPNDIGEKGGENAKFVYNNGLVIESKDNRYTLNGVTFEFHNTTTENVRINVSNDVDHAFNAIMNFVNKYNEVVEKLHGSQQEQVYRDYKPLTDEQKEEMTEKQIEQWEERAKSGILRGEAAITSGLFAMRQSWYAKVDTGDVYTSLSQIGITTSNRYLEGGKLEVDEDKLRQALRENPEAVHKLFSNSESSEKRGIINRLEDAVESTMKKIEERAGKGTHTLEQYTLGRRLKDLNERISAFEARLIRIENRYWNQFTAMEKAIQRMNEQHSYLFSQFSGQ